MRPLDRLKGCFHGQGLRETVEPVWVLTNVHAREVNIMNIRRAKMSFLLTLPKGRSK